MNRAAVLVSLLWLTGCTDNLTSAAELSDTRELGARLEVLGEDGEAVAPSRTTPRVGEQVRLRFTVENGDVEWTPDQLRSRFLVCRKGPTLIGISLCDDMPDPERASETELLAWLLSAVRPGLGEPAMVGMPELVIDVTEDLVPEPDDTILVFGMICDDGQDPIIDFTGEEPLRCSEPKPSLPPVEAHITVAWEDEDINLNPEPPSLVILDRAPWPALPEEATIPDLAARCASGDSASYLPVWTSARDEVPIQVHFQESAREPGEDLQLGYLTTAGKFDRYRGAIFPEDTRLENESNWQPPPPSQRTMPRQLVRFLFTVRDGRGGFALTERALCL